MTHSHHRNSYFSDFSDWWKMAIESAVVESLVSKIAELLAEPVIKHFSYMFCFNNFVEEFSEQWRSLALALHRVQDDVDVAIRNAEEIDIDVNKWLEDAKKALAVYGLHDVVDVATKNAEEIEIDVNKWLEDAKNEMEGENRLENEKGKNGKCFTWCPKWICLFKLSKALEKKTETLRKLEEKSKQFQKVSHIVPLQDIEFLPSKEFTRSESSNEAFEQIMKALKDDNVNMIGLYGMGGVGKTTLVQEVGRTAKETQLFDKVLLATVSQNPNVKDIQNRMAESLGLHFDEETTEGRANRLWQRLKTEKKMLVILDDVWKVVNLKEIGIPVGDDHRGCKVLLTTRDRDICSLMQCQQNVLLRILSENEAWALFKINAGLHDEDSNLNTVAKEVARECQGLPIALVTVGRALRDKSVDGWEAGIGLKEWPRSNRSFEGCTTISLMGNQLTELPEGLACPKLKVLLLELGEDLNVPARFFEGMKEIEVLSLKGGCLSLQSLEFSTNLKSLLLINCECNDLIWLRKLPRLEILCFIGCFYVKELPDEIGELRELRLLDVTDCTCLRRIPVNLIGRLKKLEELLIGGYSFEGWGVVGCDSTGGMDISLTELNLLSHLAVLSLTIPRVECIPSDFVFPKLLKYDIVLGYLERENPTEHPTSTRLYLCYINAASLNAKTFEQLFPTVSQIGFINVEGLENIALSCDQMTSHGHGSQKDFFQRLKDVEVKECRDIHTLFPAKWRQALNNLTSVEIGDCESLEVVFELGEAGEGINEEKELRLLSSLTRLELESLPELKCIWKGPTRHVSLQSLVHLELASLRKLTFIFTLSLAQSLDHLETLEIDYCSGLKHLIGEKDDEKEIIPESLGFPKLKTLSISGCFELEYVFPVSVSPSLQNLEEITISYCCNLKQIFYGGEGDAHTSDDVINFPRLRELSLSSCSFFGPKNFTAQLPSLKVLAIQEHEELGDLLAQLQGHTNLREIRIRECEGAQDLMLARHELSLLSLETLHLRSLPDMRCIWKGLVLSHLTTLEVSRCDKLTRVFTGSMVASLVQLQFLDISGCSELEQIIAKDNDDEKDQLLSGSDLQSLCFPNLCEDDHASPVNDDEREIIQDSLGFPKLKTLSISGCDKLEDVFPVSVSPSLQNLEEITIACCCHLKQIFYGGEGDAHTSDDEKDIIPESLGFPKLKTLSISGCDKLEDVFPVSVSPSLQNLEEITIACCCHLKQIFYGGEGDAHTSDDEKDIIPESLGFPKLKTLSISGCDKLEDVFPVSVSPSLQNLEEITIAYCCHLKQIFYGGEGDAHTSDDEKDIIPESLGFPKLKTLSISGCDKLEDVFPVSVSPSLLNLEEITIVCCANLKQIFYSGEGDALTRDGIINFPRLRELSLPSGYNFFGPKNFTAQFPSLQVLSIDGHEELGDLLAQLQGIINLRVIRITDCKGAQELMQVGSFGTNGRTGHELSLLSLETLSLSSLPDMRCIWKSLVASHLTTLEVSRCEKLTHVFTGSMVASLVQLESLHISDCEELEQIIAKDNDDEKDQILSGSDLQSSCFPNLCEVEIKGCNKLRSLFPVAMASGLPELQRLVVENSSQLLGVFGQDDDASPVNVEKQMEFPNLSFLWLENLPSIVWFSLGCDDFLFPRLGDLTVDECPKLTTKFARKSNGSTSAQSEVSQSSEDSSTSCYEPIKVD
ncbi:hypothetical protein OIU79_026386 [Salix purpurea]|uniref:AAA+ ATPase domain-containing protein n=1 Tax=Salix purpurea TaxID=77065 RepID=A0A9Q0VR90_SALPP|nr:hypothetical protein OIU79_026386 [Salix purpurea]